MTAKNLREAVRIARSEGLQKARIEPGGKHPRIVGEFNGKPIEVVFSMYKSFSTQRNVTCLRLNIRRALRGLQA